MSAKTVKKSEIHMVVEPDLSNLETITVTVKSLTLQEKDPPPYIIKVMFEEDTILTSAIQPLGIREKQKEPVFVTGTFYYDPSDYVKMCHFADTPLIVHIQPLSTYNFDLDMPNTDVAVSTHKVRPGGGDLGTDRSTMTTHPMPLSSKLPATKLEHISACNIDILPLFVCDQDRMCVRKRLEPMVPRPVRKRQSWDNLPLVELSITVTRLQENEDHHEFLFNSNWMKITVIGAYNLLTPHNENCYYTVATKLPVYNDQHTEMVFFSEGYKCPRKFDFKSFRPRWESLRQQEKIFAKNDEKLECGIDDFLNSRELDLDFFMESAQADATIWGSFHRSLLLGSTEWLYNYMRDYKWPMELHYYGELEGGFSFMGFLDLFNLLYAGVSRQLIAVPLHWYSSELMKLYSNCEVLMLPMHTGSTGYESKKTPRSGPGGDMSPQSSFTTQKTQTSPPTGMQDSHSFLLVEVRFKQPLVPLHSPHYFTKMELSEMLMHLRPMQGERHCKGRGLASQKWAETMQSAFPLLRCVPYHGMGGVCGFVRQMAVTMTRMEIFNSLWMSAAYFINNNFAVQRYLHNDETYKELLMMGHLCLLNIAIDTLVPPEDPTDATLRAARHARQLHDSNHAIELYLLAVVHCPFDANYWRELSTSLRPVDLEWSRVCINKSIRLNIRHPLTLLAKGCMVFEKDPAEAERFFLALLEIYPLWPTAYYVYSAYCVHMELFQLADIVMEYLSSIQRQRLCQEQPLPMAWGRELGDFWEPSPFLPGTSPYYATADLLLRIRAVRFAEVCLARGMDHMGKLEETPVYHHLVALCWYLRGNYDDALCFVRKGIQMFGQTTYLRCLEGMCLHQKGDEEGSLAAFSKVDIGSCPYTTLLSLRCWEKARMRSTLTDLLRRHPSAYAWIAFANDWMQRAEPDGPEGLRTEEQMVALRTAEACAVQALKWDRRAGRAWALLALIVKPAKRRHFCAQMAVDCGFELAQEPGLNEFWHLQRDPQKCQTRLGSSLPECLTCYDPDDDLP